MVVVNIKIIVKTLPFKTVYKLYITLTPKIKKVIIVSSRLLYTHLF